MAWNLFSNKTKPRENTNTVVLDTGKVKTIWRSNMWVMTPKGIGIIFRLGEPSLVHLVGSDGITIGEDYFATDALRQAYYEEIPQSRRGDKDKATRLGYV